MKLIYLVSQNFITSQITGVADEFHKWELGAGVGADADIRPRIQQVDRTQGGDDQPGDVPVAIGYHRRGGRHTRTAWNFRGEQCNFMNYMHKYFC